MKENTWESELVIPKFGTTNKYATLASHKTNATRNTCKFNIILLLGLANIFLFKANNRSTRKRIEICSKLTIKTLERRQ